jgi:16S rRNA (uracil1498-N3)-methyltransferase
VQKTPYGVPRQYVDARLRSGAGVELDEATAHHVARVLRMQVGDDLVLFDGSGGEYAANIASIGKRSVRVLIGDHRAIEREAAVAVSVVQGISAADRMDYTVQKAVELGVARIEPVTTARGVVRLDAERARQRTDHWQAVAIGACEQCGRNRVPPVASVLRLQDWLGRYRTGPSELGMMLDPESGGRLADLRRPSGGVTLLAGPEGGLTADERQDALRAGFVPVRLGPRVLRTETAALAALAAMQVLWGDF